MIDLTDIYVKKDSDYEERSTRIDSSTDVVLSTMSDATLRSSEIDSRSSIRLQSNVMREP